MSSFWIKMMKQGCSSLSYLIKCKAHYTRVLFRHLFFKFHISSFHLFVIWKWSLLWIIFAKSTLWLILVHTVIWNRVVENIYRDVLFLLVLICWSWAVAKLIVNGLHGFGEFIKLVSSRTNVAFVSFVSIRQFLTFIFQYLGFYVFNINRQHQLFLLIMTNIDKTLKIITSFLI